MQKENRMITDPFKVLGVSPDISDAELKKTYRTLSKKYHPDSNPDNPAAAEEKFKQVQEAYHQIMTAREKGTSPYGQAQQSTYNTYSQGNYADYSGYGAFYDFFNQWNRYSEQQRAQEAPQETNEMRAARNYINNGYYQEALNALNGTPEAERNARWYYYHAIANSCLGNNIAAMESAKRASDMEPGNTDYAQLLQQLQSGGRWYQRQGEGYGAGTGRMNMTAGLCLTFCAANALCGLCHPGFFFCI